MAEMPHEYAEGKILLRKHELHARYFLYAIIWD